MIYREVKFNVTDQVSTWPTNTCDGKQRTINNIKSGSTIIHNHYCYREKKCYTPTWQLSCHYLWHQLTFHGVFKRRPSLQDKLLCRQQWNDPIITHSQPSKWRLPSRWNADKDWIHWIEIILCFIIMPLYVLRFGYLWTF